MIKVLIVDDNELSRDMLRESLQDEEDIVIVDTASDGMDAALKIEELRPDIVLVDLVMPRLDGIGLVKKIKDEMDNEYVLPFLRWLINNTVFSDDSVLIQLFEYVRKMGIITVSNNRIHLSMFSYRKFFEDLKNPVHLQSFEDFLNLMGIECKLVLQELPDGQAELYFSQNKLVPFYSTASSGTLALTSLYQKIVSNPSLIYIDDFAAFYHYEMAEKLISFFKTKYPKCQFIMTSHNTNLMTNKIMRPDCLFILSSKGTLTALCDETERELREGHNLEKMYISGEFEKYE